MKLENGLPVTEASMNNEMLKYSKSLEPYHYDNSKRILDQLRREFAYTGYLPPISNYEEFNGAMHFPNIGPNYREA